MSGTASIVGFDRPGDPNVLAVRTAPLSVPGASEARVRVAAAGVHPADVALRAGLRPIAGPAPHVPGMAFSGVVDMAGDGSVWRAGDRVMGMALPSGRRGGAYRSVIVAPDDTLAAVPAHVDLAHAAVLPMNGHTAAQALRSLGAQPGETVAVTGAAGALGAIVVPLAAQRGLRVVAVARETDRQRVRSLGANAFVASGDNLADRIVAAAGDAVAGLVDLAVLDDEVLRAVRPGGVIATLRGWTGPEGTTVRVLPVMVPEEWHRGAQLEELADTRYLSRPLRAFAPEHAAEAHRLIASRGVRESVVIDFS